MQNNYVEDKNYQSPTSNNKDWCSCCCLLLALVLLGLIVATAFYAWGWGDDRRNVMFGGKHSVNGINTVQQYTNGTTFYDRNYANGNPQNVTRHLIQHDTRNINTVLNSGNVNNTFITPDAGYTTTTNYADSASIHNRKDGVRVVTNANGSTTTYYPGNHQVFNDANGRVFSTTNGTLNRVDQTSVNAINGVTTTVTSFPASALSDITTASTNNGDITVTSGVNTPVNQTVVQNNVPLNNANNDTATSVATTTFSNGNPTITTTKLANGTTIVDNGVNRTTTAGDSVVVVDATNGALISNSSVARNNSSDVTTTTFANGSTTYHTVPSANGALSSSANNVDFPTLQGSPFNYQPNPFNQQRNIVQPNYFTPNSYNNYANNNAGGLSNYVDFNHPLDPHELYFD